MSIPPAPPVQASRETSGVRRGNGPGGATDFAALVRRHLDGEHRSGDTGRTAPHASTGTEEPAGRGRPDQAAAVPADTAVPALVACASELAHGATDATGSAVPGSTSHAGSPAVMPAGEAQSGPTPPVGLGIPAALPGAVDTPGFATPIGTAIAPAGAQPASIDGTGAPVPTGGMATGAPAPMPTATPPAVPMPGTPTGPAVPVTVVEPSGTTEGPTAPEAAQPASTLPLPVTAGPGLPAPLQASDAATAPDGSVVEQALPAVTRLVSRGDGTHRITLKLYPVELGEIQLTVTVRGDRVDVTFAAGARAREALLDGAAQLRVLLEQSGRTTGHLLVRDLTGAPSAATPDSTAGGSASSGSGPFADPGPGAGDRNDGRRDAGTAGAGRPAQPQNPDTTTTTPLSPARPLLTSASTVDLRI